MRKSISGSLVLVLTVAALVLVLAASGKATPGKRTAAAALRASTPTATLAPPTPLPLTPPPSRVGVPAITPHLKGIPSFTIADVQHYLNTGPGTPFPGGMTTAGTRPVATVIEFITSQQASVLMKGGQTGLSDTALVCYVGLQGPFSTGVISGGPGSKPGIANTGLMVFDASTGNLLVWGFMG